LVTTFADKLTDQQRVERAKSVTDKLVDHVRSLITIAENNARVLYSDTLSRQIPRSHAAHAFNEMQRSMHYYFLVRLSAIWDKPSNDRASIPSVRALIDKQEVRDQIVNDTHKYHASLAEPRSLTPAIDPEEEQILSDHWAHSRLARASEESEKVRRWMAFAVRIVPRVERSFVSSSLRPFRDGYLAHNLEASVVNRGDPVKLRYGDEAKLLRLTIRIVDRLHLALNGAGFAWDMAQDHARRNASELWTSCHFDLPTR